MGIPAARAADRRARRSGITSRRTEPPAEKPAPRTDARGGT